MGHERTGHARSLAVPSAHLLYDKFRDVKADWAFGAGTQAVTFVSRRDEDHYVEQGLSWYASTGRLELTPGHRHERGEVQRRTLDAVAVVVARQLAGGDDPGGERRQAPQQRRIEDRGLDPGERGGDLVDDAKLHRAAYSTARRSTSIGTGGVSS